MHRGRISELPDGISAAYTQQSAKNATGKNCCRINLQIPCVTPGTTGLMLILGCAGLRLSGNERAE